MTWANSVRVLKQTFQALGGVIGGAFVNLLKPAVQSITRFLNTLIALVQKAVNAIGKLLGWQIRIDPVGSALEDDAGGAADALDDAAGGAGGVAKGLDDAADAAKKLNKQLMAYDEINNITLKEDEDDADAGSGGGGGGGGASGGGGGSTAGNATGGEVRWEKYVSDIDNWWELGRSIADTITDALNGIDWDSIYAKARRFGRNLGDFFNGLITPDMFEAIGRTIAGGGNTIVYALEELGRVFDAAKFGDSLAAGVNAFFEDFDFTALGHTIHIWASNLLQTIIHFLKGTDWELVGTKIGEFLKALDFAQIAKELAVALYEAINAAIETYANMIKVAPVETALLTLGGVLLFSKLSPVQGVAKSFNDLAASTSNFFDLVREGSRDADGKFVGFGNTLSNLGDKMTPFQKAVTATVGGIAEFFLIKDGVGDLTREIALQEPDWKNNWKTYAGDILQVAGGFATGAAAYTTVFGVPGGLIIAGVEAAAAAFAGWKAEVEKYIDTSAIEAVGNVLRNPGGLPVDDLANVYSEQFRRIEEDFAGVAQVGEGLGEARANAADLTGKIDRIGWAMDNGARATASKAEEIKSTFQQLLTDTTEIMNQEYDVILNALSGSMGDALAQAGILVPELLDTFDEIDSLGQSALTDLNDEFQGLNESYESGAIGADEYIASVSELYDKQRELLGGTQAFAEEMSVLTTAINTNQLDVSKLVADDGTFQTDGLIAQIHQVGDAYTDANKAISEAGEAYTQTAQDYIKRGEALGVSNEKIAGIEASIAATSDGIKTATATAKEDLDAYVQTLEEGLLNKVPEIIASAEKTWSEDKTLQGTISRGDYVEQVLNDYRDNVITPVNDEINNMYKELGETTRTQMDTVIGDAIKAVINPESNYFDEAAGTTLFNPKDLKANWENELAAVDFSDVFVGSVDDMVQGATDEFDNKQAEYNKKNQEFAEGGLEDGFNKGAGVSSPSWKYAESAMWMVLGAIKGINENQDKFVEAVRSMAEKGAEAFRKARQEGINSAIKNISVPRVSASSGMSGVVESQVSTASTTMSTSMDTMFADSIAPYFGEEQWSGMFTTLQSTLDTGMSGISTWFDSAMSTFFKDSVAPWFGTEKLAATIYTPIHDNNVSAFETFASWFTTTMTTWWDSDLEPWFAKDKWDLEFDIIHTSAEEAFNRIKKTIGRIMFDIGDDMHKSVKSMGDELDGISKSLKDTGELANISVAVGTNGVKAYATGGFVEDGLFFANHNELVGQFDNGRTAVANNEQIVAGIQAGVYLAVRDAMRDSGGQTVQLVGDASKLFKMVRGQAQQFRRSTGASAFT